MLIVDVDVAQGAVRRLSEALAADGLTVEVVEDPVVARQVATTTLIDALIVCTDVVGPGAARWCAALREEGAEVALLVVADEATPQAIVEVLDAGADDCVTRPVRLSEIAARLRAVERRGGGPRPAELRVGDLRLDPAGHRAWRGPVELDLSPTEFALLESLMRRPGEALTRAELLDLVWNREEEEASNLVDQVIARLRRAVDEPFGTVLIDTVRGVGYRLGDGT